MSGDLEPAVYVAVFVGFPFAVLAAVAVAAVGVLAVAAVAAVGRA